MSLSAPAVHRDIVFYPSVATLDVEEGVWRIPICGHVTGPVNVNLRKRLQLRLLRQAMKAPAEAMNSPVFRQRIEGFLAPARRGVRLGVSVCDEPQVALRKSCRNGRFAGELRLTVDRVNDLMDQGVIADGWLHYQALAPDGRRFAGRTRLVEPQGRSVISDIDDTIKHTGVLNRRVLLTSTFLREFFAVSGMAPLYRQWEQDGALFHYVSSSPWQLYRPLAMFCQEQGFPDGTFHLRAFRLSHQMLRKIFLRRQSAKLHIIDQIMRSLPQRKFLLVGDSGESDPETYGLLARRYPHQVQGILIREVEGRRMSLARSSAVFGDLPPDRFQVFRRASDIRLSLP